MTLDDLILHDSTRAHLQNFIANPSHAVLLCGPDGIGKTALAEAVVCALLAIEPAKLAGYPYYRVTAPTGASTSIETVRELQKFMQLKTAGTHPYRRAVIIEHAGTLTTEAQNAFLKLLEEPPADTLVVLTADTPRALLPTIMSRLQTITVSRPSDAHLQPLLARLAKDDTTARQAQFLSGGLPGLLTALLSGDEAHPMLANVTRAKEILQKNTFERLAMADALSKQKETALGTVEALERIAEAMLAGAAEKGETAKIKQWHRIRKAALSAREALAASANAKLTVSNLFLHL